MTALACRVWTDAPLTGVPSLARDTIPAREPVPTVKVTELLIDPFSLTVTGPVVAPVGTVAIMRVLVQLDTDAYVPLKLTKLVDP